MLKDYEFDDDDYESDELKNDGVLINFKRYLVSIYNIKLFSKLNLTNSLYVFCQTIQGRRGYKFYRLLSI